MRLRNKNWTKDYLLEHQDYLVTLSDETINPKSLFNNQNSIKALEIGCGKGDFVIKMANIHPDWNFIAMEKESTVVGVALRKYLESDEEKNKNLLFLNSYAERLLNIFSSNSFDHLYLNFSDPWPKKKHYKKRLTYQSFLNLYASLLVGGGVLEIKTDNNHLYEFSLEQLNENEFFTIIYQTTDLYNDEEQLTMNVATEYERRFHTIGKKINKIIAIRK